GVGLTETVSGHTLFLHDGRARNLTEAILWHGGQGQASRDKFAELSKADRDALLAFVNSL
ncbi:MAG: di-heme oxidoredictase family protein, partial [Methyloceanibacter sp.]